MEHCTHKYGHVLEAVDFITCSRHTSLVLQHKRDFDDPRHAGCHKRVAKHRVQCRTGHRMLSVCRHGPSREDQNESGDKVTLRGSITATAEPDTGQTGTPPDNTHGSVLPVVAPPLLSPAMLGKGVDATPSGDYSAVEELLRPTRAPQPELAGQQHDGEQCSVGDESASHDEMGHALAEVIVVAESQRRDAAKQKLHPRNDGEQLAVYAMCHHEPPANAAEEAPFDV